MQIDSSTLLKDIPLLHLDIILAEVFILAPLSALPPNYKELSVGQIAIECELKLDETIRLFERALQDQKNIFITSQELSSLQEPLIFDLDQGTAAEQKQPLLEALNARRSIVIKSQSPQKSVSAAMQLRTNGHSAFAYKD